MAKKEKPPDWAVYLEHNGDKKLKDFYSARIE